MAAPPAWARRDLALCRRRPAVLRHRGLVDYVAPMGLTWQRVKEAALPGSRRGLVLVMGGRALVPRGGCAGELSGFVGRRAEPGHVRAAGWARLIPLTGPGGIGKQARPSTCARYGNRTRVTGCSSIPFGACPVTLWISSKKPSPRSVIRWRTCFQSVVAWSRAINALRAAAI